MQKRTIRRIRQLFEELGRAPSVLILILPGQVPGQYFQEHDRRIVKAVEVWRDCCLLPCKAKILCTSGAPDKNGLTCAKYMKNQLIYFAKKMQLGEIEPCVEIGEEESGSTAHQILYSKQDLWIRNPDLVIMVSNRPHLLVAGSYFKHIVGLPFAKEWTDSANGCIGMKLIPFCVRELIHYLVSLTVDRSGRRFDEVIEKSIKKWQESTYPPIPPLVSS